MSPNTLLRGFRHLPASRRAGALALAAFTTLALLTTGAPPAQAQATDYSTAVLLRTEVEEGKTRYFQISNIPDHPNYFIFFKPLSGYTAEAADLTFKVPTQRGVLQTVAAGLGRQAFTRTTPKWTWPRLTFEVEAKTDVDTDDETFGVQLCTTADCTGGTVLGDWTLTIKDVVDTTLTGTGATITVSGGHTTMMEQGRNGDNRDHSDDITIRLAAVPTEDIVILGKVDEQVRTGGTDDSPTTKAIAKLNGPPASGGNTNNSGDWYVVTRFNTMIQVVNPGNPDADPPVPSSLTSRPATAAEMVATVSITAQQNIVDHADLTDDLKFRVVKAADADDAYADNYVNNENYTAITLPHVPVRVTGDDDPTVITLLPAATPDNIAKEGSTSDTAKFRVTLTRELASDEWIEVPLAFQGAELGTHFTLSIDGSPQGVTYMDSSDGTIGLVKFTGPSADEATVVVTGATNDGNDVSENLLIRTYRDSKLTRNNRIGTNLVDGVCAGEGCGIRISSEKRYFRMTIEEAVAGLAIIDSGNGRLLEGDITANVPEIIEQGDNVVRYRLNREVLVEGGEYSYEVRLSAAPPGNVTVAVSSSDTTKATVTTGASLTFTPGNWSMPQTVTVSAVDDSTDASDITVSITHSVTGTGSYASITDVTYTLTLVDDDATTVTMTGAGVRTSESGTQISNVMVEGDATRVDRSLTISLGRTLTAGEYVRVPLFLEATGHTMLDGSGEECDLSEDSKWTEGIENLPDWGACAIVDSIRGPRYSANVAWPVHHNDFEMKATGTGVTVEAVNRYSPAHVGFRVVEFRGAGAQTATIEFNARDGFDDGESFDEQFSITFPGDLKNIGTYVIDGYVFAPQRHINPRTNVGGGVTAAAGLAAWYGITDDDALGAVSENNVAVSPDWSLLPPGLGSGDTFRLLYVTNGETAATDRTGAYYDNFVRQEIAGAQLKQGGVPDLAQYADSFFSLVTTLGDPTQAATNPARDRAQINMYRIDEGVQPNDPIYWVGGDKVADNASPDFIDGTWDSEAPRHADGTAATVDTDGYWTGSGEHAHRTGQEVCSGGTNTHNRNQAGEPNVHVGKLDGDDSSRFSPLGPIRAQTPTCADAEPNTELRPIYGLSTTVFEVVGGAQITQRATAAEGSAITFTVSIKDAAPAGGITVPYTFGHGLGIATDPAHTVANAADFTDTAGTVVIAQGQTSNTFTVNTTNDSTYEGDHYFRVTLGEPTGTNPPGLLTGKHIGVGVITDEADAPMLEFTSATASVAEGAGSVDVTVTKTGTTALPLSVRWTTADGTASHPTDYKAQSGYLEFDTTDTTRTLTIPIIDDGTAESAETFKVQLDEDLVVAAQVGSTDETTITVTDDDDDDDGDVVVSWSQVDGSALPAAPDVFEGDSYTIKVSLASAASANVTIPLGIQRLTAEAADYTIPTSVTIQSGQSSATFDVEVLADELLEDNELLNLTLCPTASCPSGYTSGDTPPTIEFIFKDPSVVVDASSIANVSPTAIKLLEEGGIGTFTIALEKDPTVDVTITVKAVDGDHNISAIISGTASEHIGVDTNPNAAGFQDELTFTGGGSGNWNVPRTVRIHALYDGDVDTGNLVTDYSRYSIGFLNSAASGPYKAQVNTNDEKIQLAVSDAGNAVVVSPNAVSVAESGTVEYDVQLASDPGGTVVVTPTSSDTTKATVSSALTFTSSDWGVPQQITVTGVAAGSTAITHAVTTATTAYPMSLTIEDVDVTVTAGDVLVSWSQTDDSDLPGVIPVTEGGPAFTVKVSLASAAPAGGVTIPLGITYFRAIAGDVTVPASVTIPAGQTSATFAIEANVDELLEFGETFIVTLCPTTGDNTCPSGYTSGDPPANRVTQISDPGLIADFSSLVTIDFDDNGVRTGETFHPGQEGGEVTLSVKLAVDPLVDVTITPKVVDGLQIGDDELLPNLINGAATEFVAVDTDPDTDGLQSTLTFTGGNAGNWNTEQSFTLHFLYDDDVTNDVEDHPDDVVSEAGDVYTIGFLNRAASGPYKEQTHNGKAQVGLTQFRVKDAGNAVVVSPDAVSVGVSGTVEYDVQLASDPGGTVVVTPTSSDTTKATVSGALTFTSSDWGVPQQITVTGVIAGATTITHAVTTGTTAYPTTKTIEDVDVTVTAGARNLDIQVADAYEGENIVVTLTLSQAPGNVPAAQRTIQVSPQAPTSTAVDACIASHGCAAGSTHADAADYTSGSVSVVFGANETVKTASIPVVADSVSEGVEVVLLNIRYQPNTNDLGIFAADSQITGRNDFSGVAPLLVPGIILIGSYGQILGDSRPTVPITVTMTASDGDADGNAVEGASGATGYRTITVSLGRALTASETVTVPLTVAGATVTDDYTFALEPSAQTGVSLSTSGSHSAQDPALEFSSGGQTATLRLTPVDNNTRSQPRVIIVYGTGSRAPSAGGGASLGNVSGGPFSVVLVDDETGDIEVPANWALAPAGLSAGDEFRLMFITSQTRTAESTDIDVYNEWAAGVVATNGHPNLLPYGDLVRVVGSTAGRDARVNAGMWSSGAHADGSTQDSDSGVKIYWLAAPPSNKVADNYFDFYDNSWDGGADQSGADTTESGAARTPTASFWTGSNNDGQKADAANRLGSGNLVNTALVNSSNRLSGSVVPRNEMRPMLVMSPVFKVSSAPPPDSKPTVGVVATTGTVTEGSAMQFTVTVTPQQTSALSVRVRYSGGGNFGVPERTLGEITIPPNTGTHAFSYNTRNDDVDYANADVMVRLQVNAAYNIDSDASSATVTVEDNDDAPTGVRLTARPLGISEIDSAQTITVTAAVNGSTRYGTNKRVRVKVTGHNTAGQVKFEKVENFVINVEAGAASGEGVFTLTPTDDDVHTKDGEATIRGDLVGGGGDVVPGSVSIQNDDRPQVTLSASPDTIGEGEGPTDVTVTATLDKAFSEVRRVGITLSPDSPRYGTARDEYFIKLGAGEKMGTTTIRIRPVDNAIQEDDLSINLVGIVDGGNTGIGIVTLTDNDTPSDAIVISKSALHLKEGGGTQTYLVALTEDPGETVTLTVKSHLPRSVKVSTAHSPAADGTATMTFTGGASGTWKTPQVVTVWPMDEANTDSEQNISITHSTSVSSGAGTFHKATGPIVRAYVSDNDDPTEGLWATYRNADYERPIVIEEDGGKARLPLVLSRELEAGETVAMRVRVTGGDYGTHFTAKTNTDKITVTPETFTDIVFDDKGDNDPSNDVVTTTERETGVLIVTWTEGATRQSPRLIFTAVDDGAAATGERYLEVEVLSAYSPDGSAGIDDDQTTPDGVRLLNRVQTERIHILAKDRLQLWQAAQDTNANELVFTDMELEPTSGSEDTEIVTNNTTTTLAEGNLVPQGMLVSFTGRPTGATGDIVVTASVSDPSKLKITHSGGDIGPLTYRSGRDVTATTTFSLEPIADADADNEVVYVYFTVSGYGDVYPADAPARWFRVLITDDNAPGVEIDPLNVTLIEGETRGEIVPGTNPERRTNQLAVRLRTDPGRSVALTPQATNPDGTRATEVTFNKARLTFKSSNWNDWQLITVRHEDADGDVNDNKYIVSFTAVRYVSVSPEVSVTSIDTSPAVRVSTDTLELYEGQADSSDERSRGRTYSVVLQAPPPGDAPVLITPTLPGTGVAFFDDGFSGRGTTHRALRFGASNWDSPRTVTVYPRGDSGTTDDTVTITHSVSGYGSVTAGPDVEVTVRDSGGAAGLELSHESLIVHEGTSATIRVRLASRPSAAVTLTVSGASGDLTVDTNANTANDQNTITIAPDNWHVWRTITLTAADESDASNKVDERFTLTIAASGGGYGSVSETVGITVYDDEYDGPTFTVSITGTAYTEGGGLPLIFTVQSDVAVSSNTDVTLNISESGDFIASADEGDQTLRFTTSAIGNHTVNLVDDGTAEAAGTVTATLKPGAGYRVGTPSAVTVNVEDDDGTPGTPTLTFAQAAYSVAEAGGTIDVTVNASSAPSSALMVNLDTGDEGAAAGSDFTAPGTTLTFPASTTSHTFSVAITDDSILEANEDFTLTLASGTGYIVGSPASTTVTITDNDTATIELAAASYTVLEGAGTASLTVKVTSSPTTVEVPLTVTLTPANGTAMGASGGTGADFDSDAVTVAGAKGSNTVSVAIPVTNDNAAEVDETFTVTLSTNQARVSVGTQATATVTIADNDNAKGLVFTPATVSLNENGSATYTVHPTTAPTSDVTLSVTVPGGSDLTIDTNPSMAGTQTTALTFTTANWYIGQPVEVSAGDDADTANDVAMLTHSPTGGGYSSSHDADLTVNTNDDDTALPIVSITPVAAMVTEGTAATFTVTATPAPAANLTVNLTVVETGNFGASPTGSRTVSVSTTGSATFTVSTTGDTVDDANGSVAVTLGTGTGYTVSSTSGTATVAVNDDDATPSSITLSVDDNSVSEDDSPAPTISVTATVDGSTQFRVAKTVTVSVTPQADTTSTNYVDMTAVNDFDITIPAGMASHSQSFTLTPDNDLVDETDNTVTVSGSISGDSATTINSATIALTDDDATPTAIALTASPSTVTENGGGQTITVTAAVSGTRFGVAKTVAVSVAGHDTAGSVQFSQVSNFNINIAAEAASGQGQFTLTPTDNNAVDNDGEATISGTLAGPTVTGTSVTITDDEVPPVTVAMAGSDGDANGNAVEGANNATGYRTVTISLGRALTGAETVTVPLTVAGAAVTTDYTFGLQPTSQTGVSLTTTGGTHTAQNPAVEFAAGATSATLRLTPVDNNDRTQPYVVIDYGTGARAPSGAGVTLDPATGGPIGIVLVDDETGSLTVPADWPLKPAAVAGGGTFRLIYITSQSRNAEATDIDVYNAFVQNVTASGGHANLKPYAGLATVIGSTTATDARENIGMWDPSLNSGNGAWADGSASAADSGTAIYWLGAPPASTQKTADNYYDFFDGGWDTGADNTGDAANEAGTAISTAHAFHTGANDNGRSYSGEALGDSIPRRGNVNSLNNTPLDEGAGSTKATSLPFLAMSPVFTVAVPPASVPELTFSSATYSGDEDGGTIDVTVNASSAPTSDLTVNLTSANGTATGGGTDFSNPPTTFTFGMSNTSETISIAIIDDLILENHEDFTLTLGSGTGYTVGTPASTTVTITDQDAVMVRIKDATATVGEGDGNVIITVLKDGDADIGVQATLTPSDGTATGGSDAALAGVDYDNDPITPITIPAGVSSVDLAIAINDDSVAEPSETFTVALTVISGQRGVTLGSTSTSTVTITDNDPLSVTMAGSDGDADGNAVEGAGGSTGYRTITITLGQAVPGSETVTVPLTVQGATVGTDYTFALHGTNTGVSLTTSGGTHTAQNPAVVFAAGASSATLRLTPVDNNMVSQPHVVIDYGTGGRAPAGTGGLTLATPAGGPISVVFVDDESTSNSGTETDPIEVPPDWPLTPTGLSAGDNFRLMFMTSEGRDASSSDITDYDAFVRRIGAGNGHPNILPYIGYFKAFGNTRSTTATTQNVAARGHVGMWTSGTSVWTDGSTSDSSSGTPIHWLDGSKISDNYFDFCDNSWDNRWSSSTNFLKHEDGNAADGSKVWTGMNNNCALNANALGATQTVWAPGTQAPSGGPLNKGSEANTNGNRFYAMSPVFKVEVPPAPPTPQKPTGFTVTAGNGQVTLSWNDPNQSSITTWQYRQKSGSGSYGNWITISGSSATTTSHTVTGLTNGVTYAFTLRAWASNAGGSVGGLPSDEHTATPTVVAIDPDAPKLLSIQRYEQPVKNLGTSLVWRVRFNKHLPGVYASDFTLTGTSAGLDVRHDLSNYDPTTYKTVVFVYAQGGDLDTASGAVTLSIASNHNIADFEGRRLASTTPTGANQHTFTLNPNQTLVYFSQPDYYVNEGKDAVVTFKLSRLQETDTLIRFSATPLTATGSGVDYHGSTFSVTIPARRSSGTVNIRTSEDGMREEEETFRLDLHDGILPAGFVSTNARGSANPHAYIHILDKETADYHASREPGLEFDNAHLTWNEGAGCDSGTGPTYNVKLTKQPLGPVEVWIKDPDDDYRSDYVAKGRLYVENSPQETRTVLRFTPDNWNMNQLVNVKVRCADHYTAQIPIKHRMYAGYIDKFTPSPVYPGHFGVIDKGWTVHVKVRENNPPIVVKHLPVDGETVDVKEGGHVDFEITLSEAAFEHDSRIPVYLSARGGKAAGVKRRDGDAHSCGGPLDDCLYFTPDNRTRWVRLFAINTGRDELKVEIPQLRWGDLIHSRDWDLRWPVEVMPTSQGAPAQNAAAPTEAVSNLQVTAIDAGSASVTWNPVEHARFYEVSWEAESSDQQTVITGIESVAGTSATIRHDAQEDMTLTVTVTPEFVNGNGLTQRMEALAATATLNIGPSTQQFGNGGGTNGGGDGGNGPISAGTGTVDLPAPVTHWRFDGDAGDSAGSSDGTAMNGAAFAANGAGAGVGSHALSLDGVDDYVDLASHASSLPLGNSARSVAGWFRADAGGQGQTLLSYGPNVAGQRFSIAADRTQAVVGVSGHAWGVNGLDLADGWHHVAVTYAGGDSDAASIYLDGALQTASTLGGTPQPLDTQTGPAAIGRNAGGTKHYAGSIDDVRLYDAALTAEQVRALFDEHPQTPQTATTATTAITATAAPALAEDNLDGAQVTLTLDAGAYAATVAASDVTASGVTGLSIASVTRDSDSQATATLSFDGTDFDANATLTLTVSAGALSHSDANLSATLPVTALDELPPLPVTTSVTATATPALAEDNLDGAQVTLTLDAGAFAGTLAASDVAASGVSGVSVSSVTRDSDSQATATLSFDGTDFDANATLALAVSATALAHSDANLTATLPVTAVDEPPPPVTTAVTATPTPALAEDNLDGAQVVLTLDAGSFAATLAASDLAASGVAGVGVSSLTRDSDSQATATLSFDGTDFDADATLTLAVSAAALSHSDASLTATLPVTAVDEPPPDAAIPAALAHWRFDGDADDSAGSSDGTAMNGAAFAANGAGAGVGSHALSLDGVDDYVDLASHTSSLPLGNSARSVTGWFRADAGSQGQTLLSYGPNVAGQRFSIAADRTQAVVGVSGHAWGVNGLDLADGWHHVAVAYPGGDSDSISIYLDGALRTAATLAGAPQALDTRTGPAAIGRSATGTRHYAGLMDDVRLYDVALTAEQVRALFDEHPQSAQTAQTPQVVTTAVAATATPALAEDNLDGAQVALALDAGAFAATVAASDVTASGVSGVGVSSVTRDSDTQATATLSFDGTDFDADATLTLAVSAVVLAHSDADLSATLPVAAVDEPPPPVTKAVTATAAPALAEGNLDGADVELTLDAGAFAATVATSDVTASGVSGVGVSSVTRDSDTQATATLSFDGTDFDADATLTLAVSAAALAHSDAALSATLPVAAVDEPPPPPAVSIPAPLAHWKFDGDADDSAGSSDGAAMDGASFTTAARVGSHALSLDGVDDHVDLASHAWGFPLGDSARSVTGWFRADAGDQRQTFLTYGPNVEGKRLSIAADRTQALVAVSGHAWGVNNLSLSDGWHHVAVTFAGGRSDGFSIYLDGALQSASTLGGFARQVDTRAGSAAIGRNAGGNAHYGGAIDDVRLYDYALSAAQVAAIAGRRDALSAASPDSPVHLPLLPSPANGGGVVRIANLGARAGAVEITAIDDAGWRRAPITLNLDGRGAVELTAHDLERGGAALGLAGGTGPATGDWRLEVATGLNVEARAHVQAAGGAPRPMHGTVPAEGGVHQLALFLPAGVEPASVLRLTNRGGEATVAVITGTDDAGAARDSVRVPIPAGASVRLGAAELERGGAALDGALGDGAGLWRLAVAAEGDLAVMHLIEGADGRLANLSRLSASARRPSGAHGVTRFPVGTDASGRWGVLRIVNRSAEAGTVRIEPSDGSAWDHEPLTLALGAGAAVNLDAWDLELGNPSRGLPRGAGPGVGAWRLAVSSDLDIEVLAYVRSPTGLLEPLRGAAADVRER